MSKRLTVGDARVYSQASESSRSVELQYMGQRSTIISTLRVHFLPLHQLESLAKTSAGPNKYKSTLTHSPFPPLSRHKLSLLKVEEDPKRTAYKEKVACIEKKAVHCFGNDLFRKLR